MPVHIMIAAAGIAAVFVIILLTAHSITHRRNRMDEMEGGEFEAFCAGLLEDAGFSEVEVTAASGDFGADILCQKDGVTYAVQCKRYESMVGLHAVQEVYAAKDYYGCMVAAVMCNQYFTKPAVKMADRLHVLLWDRDYIEEMESEAGER